MSRLSGSRMANNAGAARGRASARKCARRASASVLVGLLWCLALLSVMVIGVLHTSSLDLRVVKNYGDQIQAHYLALAGIEKAKAVLYHDAITRQRSAQNHTAELADAPDQFRDIPLGRGQFRVIRQGDADEGARIIYGVRDEESRLNINQCTPEELANLGRIYKMTPDLVASILDWRDEDNQATPNGAELEYYSSLQPPYRPRNGAFQTVRELLMVRGMDRDLFLGEDVNQNGLLDPDENDGTGSYPVDNRDGVLDAGWSGLITVNSSVRNVNAAGQDRVNVQTADERSLTSVRGITTDIAKAIVASRGQNQLESLADLLEVSAPVPGGGGRPPVVNRGQNQPGSPVDSRGVSVAAPSGGGPQPGGTRGRGGSPGTQPGAAPSGPKVVSEELLMEIADDLTTLDTREQAGAININSASADVLACLPGVDPQLAQAIIAYRRSAGFLPNIAWLLKVQGMNRQIFKQVAPRVTARSETFRILSEGTVTSTGARKRVEVIVRLGASTVDTLSYREDL